MPALPSAADITGVTANTHIAIKTAVADQRAYLAALFGTDGTVATALDTLGALGGVYAAKSAGYTVVATDRGTVFSATGNWTLSLTAVATLGAGFSFVLLNSGTSNIVIDPAGAETIDGLATITVQAGAAVLAVCSGSAWITAPFMRGLAPTTEDWDAIAQSQTQRNSLTTATGVPSANANWVGWTAMGTASIAGQIAMRTGQLLFRVKSTTWGAWSRVKTDLDLFSSAQQTITASGGLTLAHGLGVVPVNTKMVLVCATAEAGYAIADQITEGLTGIAAFVDATNVGIRFAATVGILNKTTGAAATITPANWRLIARAWA